MLPRIVRGCPEKNPYPIPQIKPETKDSIAAILFPVAEPRRPPNVMIGDKQAKYKNIHDAIHCVLSASLKSEKYHGIFRRKSFFNPPNSVPVRSKPDSSRSRCSSSSSLISFEFGFSG